MASKIEECIEPGSREELPLTGRLYSPGGCVMRVKVALEMS